MFLVSHVWLYYGNEYRIDQGLNPNQVLAMLGQGCDGIRPLINYLVINVLGQGRYVKATARIYRGNDDALIHFVITIDGGSKEVMVIVSRNPADTLFNYYTSPSSENFVECGFD